MGRVVVIRTKGLRDGGGGGCSKCAVIIKKPKGTKQIKRALHLDTKGRRPGLSPLKKRGVKVD